MKPKILLYYGYGWTASSPQLNIVDKYLKRCYDMYVTTVTSGVTE